MKDYWHKLNISEAWSRKRRFNRMVEFIDEYFDVDNINENDDEEVVVLKDLSVSVKNSLDENVSNANIILTNNSQEFTGTTGTAGGCNITDFPLRHYTYSATAENYVDKNGEIEIIDGDNTLEIILDEVTFTADTGGEPMEEE